ncbi:HD domain-containing protein [Pontibacillus salicampi]|uniref:HD domain-containing protein n=1 Tax=Pontibacillus salicampi TaxID=1449801 RepID=A0ABV6LLY9_9BACI
MKIVDSIYGEFIIHEPVLEELLHTEAIQRLKGVHQGGASYLVNPQWNGTRYEHSVGVMLFIRKMGGSLSEQIAGLLHDVSHTAFSHVIDYVLEEQEENYHEQIFQSMIEKSTIPEILHRYGFCQEVLFNEKNWKILEQPLPDLCADRLDYTLRDMYHYERIPYQDIQWFLNQLDVEGPIMSVESITAAEWFVDLYYKEVVDFFMHPLNVYGSKQLTNVLSIAWEKGFIAEDDFRLDDESLLCKIRSSNDPSLDNELAKLEKNVAVVEDELHFEYYQQNKLRYIDPLVKMEDGTYQRSSLLSDTIKVQTEKAKEKMKKGTYVRRA